MPRSEYVEADKTFVNPYYFLPIEDGCPRDAWETYFPDEESNTGWMECELKTLGPLFIPNTTNDDVFPQGVKGLRSYDFYSYTDLSHVTTSPFPPVMPIIPGSELRGMFRSEFEALTNSCLSAVNDDPLFKRRTVPANRIGRLILENNEWFFEPGEKYKIEQALFEEHLTGKNEGDAIWFLPESGTQNKKVRRLCAETDPGAIQGFIHFGEPMDHHKHYETIFVPDTDDPEPIDKNIMKHLLENYKLYKDDTVNIHKRAGRHTGYEKIDVSGLKKLDHTIVYIKQYGTKMYLSPAAIGREVFDNTLEQLLGLHSPCQEISSLCPACALFGMVGKDAVGSRVRFMDAVPATEIGEDQYFDRGVLAELASPKLSASEFYLVPPERNGDRAALWNYDYAGTWGRDGRTPDFETWAEYRPRLAGRKFYWHQPNRDPVYITDPEKMERSACVRPLRAGTEFTFKIYFDEISDRQLAQLLWMMSGGGSADLAHKLGHGKPLGLGSIQVSVKAVNLRTIALGENSVEYHIQARSDLIFPRADQGLLEHLFPCARSTIDAFLRGMNFTECPVNVTYPHNTDTVESYQWFVENRKIDGTGTAPVIHQVLPPITEPPTLQQYRQVTGTSPRPRTPNRSSRTPHNNQDRGLRNPPGVRPPRGDQRHPRDRDSSAHSSQPHGSESSLAPRPTPEQAKANQKEDEAIRKKSQRKETYLADLFQILSEFLQGPNPRLELPKIQNQMAQKPWDRNAYKDFHFGQFKDAVQAVIEKHELELKIEGNSIVKFP